MRQALAEQIGADGLRLLRPVYAPEAPGWLREVPAIEALRRIRVQQYAITDGTPRWRTGEDELPPPATFSSSPHDRDLHLARKREATWIGYTVHRTETCDDGLPPLITHVETTLASTVDGEATPRIHAALRERDLLPRTHVVDTGFLDADLLVASRREYDVDLLGPTRLDDHWQAREQPGFAVAAFHIDWDKREAVCPAGRTSPSWTPAVDKGTNAVITITFSSRDRGPCPCRERCTRSLKRSPRRTLTVRTGAAYHALQDARARARTPAYAAEYDHRAGIEGTLSRGVRRCGLRRARSIGLAKTHLQHILIAVALNILRIGEWLLGLPRARTRVSAFARLTAAAT